MTNKGRAAGSNLTGFFVIPNLRAGEIRMVTHNGVRLVHGEGVAKRG